MGHHQEHDGERGSDARTSMGADDGVGEGPEGERAGRGAGERRRKLAVPELPSAALVLLAVDLGLRTGLALYGRDGRLVSYRSQNLGTRTRLRRAASSVLGDLVDVERLVLEGGGDIAEIWKRAGERAGLAVRVVDAGRWRRLLLLPRERRTGADAKSAADGLARSVIEWSGAPRPKGDLRHDAAEAIAVGLWGVIEAGWLGAVPEPVRRR